MRRFTFLASFVLFLSSLSFGQLVTVTADLKTLFGNAQTTNAKLCFSLIDGAGNPIQDPRVSVGLLIFTQTVCAVPDNTGHVSTSLEPNDLITPTGSQYSVEEYLNGQFIHGDNFTFSSGNNYNLNTMTPNQSGVIPPAPPQPLTGGLTFLFTQSTPAQTWTINHNFGTPGVVATFYDTNGKLIFPDTETETNTNTLTATFLVAQAGTALITNAGNWTPSALFPNYIIGNPTSAQTIGDQPLNLLGPLTGSGDNLFSWGGPGLFSQTGIFTNTANNCTLQSMLNGASINMFSSSGLGFFTQDGVCGGIIIPLGSSVSQANGVNGTVENHSNGPAVTSGTASMGGYFQNHNFGSNTNAWGINTVGVTMTGANNSAMFNEVDFDVQTGVTGATVEGWAINAPLWDSLPASAYGTVIGKPTCTTPNFSTYPATGCPQWTAAYFSAAGASSLFGVASQAGVGTTQNSGRMRFVLQDSGNVQHFYDVYASSSDLLRVERDGVQLVGVLPTQVTLNPTGGNGTSSLALVLEGINGSGVAKSTTLQTDSNGAFYLNSAAGTFNFENSGSIEASVGSTGLGSFNGGLKAGSSGSTIAGDFTGSATLTYTAIAAQTCQEQTLTVTGATSGKPTFASPAATPGSNLSWSAWVSASNTVSVRVCNPSAGPITPAAVSWQAWVLQ
jgi:hypothetical protein